MARTLSPDICVIGAGSGGLTVAAAAAAFGVDVVLIEKGRMGGDCLNYGCVPSKALIAAAGRANTANASAGFGIGAAGVTVDFASVHDHVHEVIGVIAPHDSVERFEGLGVTVIQAAARFTDPSTVVAGDATIKARRFVVATGSRPLVPPIPGLDRVPFLTNETIFDLKVQPQHLVVIGGGPIGLELAQAHSRLGARVTVVEAQVALSRDDPEMAALVLRKIREEGVDILEKTVVIRVEGEEGDIRVTISAAGEEKTLEASHLLIAAGRTPNLEGLGLDEAGIVHDRRGISVGKNLRSSNRRVYAIGDVAGGYQFTHVAGYHGSIVVQALLFRLPAKENRDIIPWVTFTEPELGHVGLSEKEAKARYGERLRVLTASFSGNDKAQTARQTEGWVKLFVGPRGRLLGADIVGPSAGEIVNLLSLALSRKMTMGQIAGFVAPYPSLAEIVKRAALSYYSEVPKRPMIRRIVGILAKFG